jgi:hypothetical protein
MVDTEIKEAVTEQTKQPKILRFLAMIITVVLHPVFMPSYMTFLLYKLTPTSFAGFQPEQFVTRFLFPVIFSTFFLPVLFTILTKAVGFIESIQMHNPKDRIIPLVGIMIFYFWINNVMDNINAPLILRVLIKGSYWGVILLFLSNIFYKVSMHTAAAGSMLGLLIVLLIISPVNMAFPFFAGLFIAGLIGTARLILSAHTIREIWIGYMLGILVQVGAYYYLV